MARVSLIIPTFSRPHLLPGAVESAFRAARDVEVIVVDDASSDKTASVCASLRNVKYVRVDRNQGVAGARNIGVLASTSEFIAFLDDDDVRLPDSLEHQLSLFDEMPEAGFVAGGVLLADQACVPNGKAAVVHPQRGDLFWPILEFSVHLIPGSVVVRKSCFCAVGLFKKRLAGIDDWDMWVRIAELYPVVVDQQAVCVYRCPTPGSDQGSSALARHLHSALKHQRQLLSLPRAQGESYWRRRAARRNTKRRIADTLTWRAAEELPHGAWRFAASNFVTSVRLSPMWALRPTHVRVLCQGFSNQKKLSRLDAEG